GVDLVLYRWLQNLRTPWADRLMVTITELGDAAVLTAVVATVALWLAWLRRWKALAHWLATAAGAALMVRILKLTLQVPRPIPLYEGGGAFAFPSAHAGTNLAVYGFLAVLVARELGSARRWLPYTAAAALVVFIAFSRLYLGAHWLSDVIGGLSLGLSWTALMGIAYRRHPAPPVPPRGLVAVALASLMAAGSWQVQHHLDTDVQRYAQRHTTVTLAPTAWWTSGWRTLPAYRMDLEGEHEHPLTVQWAGNLQGLKAVLARGGWHAPVAASVANSLLWLSPATPFKDLPVLPQVHAGRHEALLLTHAGADPDRLLVLRLWPTAVVLGDEHEPLWIGNVTALVRKRLLGFVTLPHTGRDYDGPLQVLAGDLNGLDLRLVRRTAPPASEDEAPRWNGQVLLARSPPAAVAPATDHGAVRNDSPHR
ncbi:MAG: phosphatase PAP2 family protein, partial [Gammaproteobacteria bacterium]